MDNLPTVPDSTEVVDRWSGIFCLTPDETRAKRRTRRHTACRACIAHELHESNWYSLDDIGEILGGRDHSTISYLLSTYDNRGAKTNGKA